MLERFGFNALGYRPFRTFFLANFVGNSSWFVFNAGFGWLVLVMTGSAATVGLAFFVTGLPAMLLTLHAGLLTDRFGARPLVAISFALTGLIMIAFGLLALSFPLPLWVVLAVRAGPGHRDDARGAGLHLDRQRPRAARRGLERASRSTSWASAWGGSPAA